MSGTKIWTVLEILNWSTDYLKSKNITSARLDADLLLSSVWKCKRIDLYLRHDDIVPEDILDFFKALLLRRARGEPIAYILGQRDFWKHSFMVGSGVLVPRPETEILVEQAIIFIDKLLENDPNQIVRVLDVGTGSGCIALSLALHFGDKVDVWAWDKSPQALKFARANAEQLGCKNIHIEQVDVNQLSEQNRQVKFALIVSNPPYVRPGDSDLDPAVLEFEPKEALFPEEKDFYSLFASDLGRALLLPHGVLIFEIGGNYWKEYLQPFSENKHWSINKTCPDLQGHVRVFVAGFNEDKVPS